MVVQFCRGGDFFKSRTARRIQQISQVRISPHICTERVRWSSDQADHLIVGHCCCCHYKHSGIEKDIHIIQTVMRALVCSARIAKVFCAKAQTCRNQVDAVVRLPEAIHSSSVLLSVVCISIVAYGIPASQNKLAFAIPGPMAHGPARRAPLMFWCRSDFPTVLGPE